MRITILHFESSLSSHASSSGGVVGNIVSNKNVALLTSKENVINHHQSIKGKNDNNNNSSSSSSSEFIKRAKPTRIVPNQKTKVIRKEKQPGTVMYEIRKDGDVFNSKNFLKITVHIYFVCIYIINKGIEGEQRGERRGEREREREGEKDMCVRNNIFLNNIKIFIYINYYTISCVKYFFIYIFKNKISTLLPFLLLHFHTYLFSQL